MYTTSFQFTQQSLVRYPVERFYEIQKYHVYTQPVINTFCTTDSVDFTQVHWLSEDSAVEDACCAAEPRKSFVV